MDYLSHNLNLKRTVATGASNLHSCFYRLCMGVYYLRYLFKTQRAVASDLEETGYEIQFLRMSSSRADHPVLLNDCPVVPEARGTARCLKHTVQWDQVCTTLFGLFQTSIGFVQIALDSQFKFLYFKIIFERPESIFKFMC